MLGTRATAASAAQQRYCMLTTHSMLTKISGGHRRQQCQLSVHAAEEGKDPQAL